MKNKYFFIAMPEGLPLGIVQDDPMGALAQADHVTTGGVVIRVFDDALGQTHAVRVLTKYPRGSRKLPTIHEPLGG